MNPYSVVIMDNASIDHVEQVSDLVGRRAGARLCFLSLYSPDLNPCEEVFSQIKNMMSDLHDLFEVATEPRPILATLLGSISADDWHGYITHCGYI